MTTATAKQKKVSSIALVGNPNSGKSSLFNFLTGLNQQVGNYPGVTVDKKTGSTKLDQGQIIEVTDLPGTYSLHPQSLDEAIVLKELLIKKGSKPDLVVYTADSENLARNLLLFTQIRDLGYPMILALTMPDRVKKAGREIDIQKLSKALSCPVVSFNGISGEGLEELKSSIPTASLNQKPLLDFEPEAEATESIRALREHFNLSNDYQAWTFLVNDPAIVLFSDTELDFLNQQKRSIKDKLVVWRRRDTLRRYTALNRIVRSVMTGPNSLEFPGWDRFDRFLTHPVSGYSTFLLVLLVVFQAIFTVAAYPMDWIDMGFAWLSAATNSALPEGMISDLLTEGIIPGLGGVVIFIPQIAMLFFFIKLMEETGYMSRVVFLMDRLMRPFGLNGKSVVPLMSGVACAIPAIMATRNIENWRERLLTIMVTPFMTCSARLPVYTILIALLVPAGLSWGPFGVQGLILLSMYLLGTLAALLSALVLRLFIEPTIPSFLILEMPVYRKPNWRNVFYAIIEKTKAFVFNAGKIIFGISIVLWFLASYSPKPKQVEQRVAKIEANELGLAEEDVSNKVQSYKLEQSFAGHLGRFIEPVIEPLGYDWKIGIALVTSFAAREVFVGTLATIYSVGADDADERSILAKMGREKDSKTGAMRYSAATCISLLLFYAFAMQCMSTVAIVKRETKTWKWPMIQLVYMSVLAYVAALIGYQLTVLLS